MTHFDWSALQSERGPAAADLVSSRPALVQEFPPVLIFCLREKAISENEKMKMRGKDSHVSICAGSWKSFAERGQRSVRFGCCNGLIQQ